MAAKPKRPFLKKGSGNYVKLSYPGQRRSAEYSTTSSTHSPPATVTRSPLRNTTTSPPRTQAITSPRLSQPPAVAYIPMETRLFNQTPENEEYEYEEIEEEIVSNASLNSARSARGQQQVQQQQQKEQQLLLNFGESADSRGRSDESSRRPQTAGTADSGFHNQDQLLSPTTDRTNSSSSFRSIIDNRTQPYVASFAEDSVHGSVAGERRPHSAHSAHAPHHHVGYTPESVADLSKTIRSERTIDFEKMEERLVHGRGGGREGASRNDSGSSSPYSFPSEHASDTSSIRDAIAFNKKLRQDVHLQKKIVYPVPPLRACDDEEEDGESVGGGSGRGGGEGEERQQQRVEQPLSGSLQQEGQQPQQQEKQKRSLNGQVQPQHLQQQQHSTPNNVEERFTPLPPVTGRVESSSASSYGSVPSSIHPSDSHRHEPFVEGETFEERVGGSAEKRGGEGGRREGREEKGNDRPSQQGQQQLQVQQQQNQSTGGPPVDRVFPPSVPSPTSGSEARRFLMGEYRPLRDVATGTSLITDTQQRPQRASKATRRSSFESASGGEEKQEGREGAAKKSQLAIPEKTKKTNERQEPLLPESPHVQFLDDDVFTDGGGDYEDDEDEEVTIDASTGEVGYAGYGSRRLPSHEDDEYSQRLPQRRDSYKRYPTSRRDRNTVGRGYAPPPVRTKVLEEGQMKTKQMIAAEQQLRDATAHIDLAEAALQSQLLTKVHAAYEARQRDMLAEFSERLDELHRMDEEREREYAEKTATVEEERKRVEEQREALEQQRRSLNKNESVRMRDLLKKIEEEKTAHNETKKKYAQLQTTTRLADKKKETRIAELQKANDDLERKVRLLETARDHERRNKAAERGAQAHRYLTSDAENRAALQARRSGTLAGRRSGSLGSFGAMDKENVLPNLPSSSSSNGILKSVRFAEPQLERIAEGRERMSEADSIVDLQRSPRLKLQQRQYANKWGDDVIVSIPQCGTSSCHVFEFTNGSLRHLLKAPRVWFYYYAEDRFVRIDFPDIRGRVEFSMRDAALSVFRTGKEITDVHLNARGNIQRIELIRSNGKRKMYFEKWIDGRFFDDEVERPVPPMEQGVSVRENGSYVYREADNDIQILEPAFTIRYRRDSDGSYTFKMMLTQHNTQYFASTHGTGYIKHFVTESGNNKRKIDCVTFGTPINR